jgi:hypothetical protein
MKLTKFKINLPLAITFPKLIVLLLMVLLIIGVIMFNKRNKNTIIIVKKNNSIDPDNQPEYLSHKMRCADCEKQMLNECGESCVWRAQQTKSFDSERELVGRSGNPNLGYVAKTVKYY